MESRGDWPAVNVGLHGATGSEEKGNRLKEKPVVPVVQAGKVEKLPKRLCGMELKHHPVF
jgi:hypothetical protein